MYKSDKLLNYCFIKRDVNERFILKSKKLKISESGIEQMENENNRLDEEINRILFDLE